MNNFNPDRQIAIIWDIDDVQSIRPDLDDDEAMQVLSAVDNKHDATIGVNWDVLEFWADELYPQEDEEEEDDE